MPRTRSIRQRLLADQVLLILLLGGGILATTFLGARRAVETLSRGIVERAAVQAESELRRFFADRPGVAASLAGDPRTGEPRADALLDELSRFSRGIEVSERGVKRRS